MDTPLRVASSTDRSKEQRDAEHGLENIAQNPVEQIVPGVQPRDVLIARVGATGERIEMKDVRARWQDDRAEIESEERNRNADQG